LFFYPVYPVYPCKIKDFVFTFWFRLFRLSLIAMNILHGGRCISVPAFSSDIVRRANFYYEFKQMFDTSI
jgi:hypothetical protein